MVSEDGVDAPEVGNYFNFSGIPENDFLVPI